MFEFAYPWVFVLLLLPFAINKMPLYYRANRFALRISFKEDIDAINSAKSDVSGISRATSVQKALLALLYLLVVTALAKPQYIAKPLSQDVSQRELLVSIDLSGSMQTKDFKDANGTLINRLDAVKMVLGNFFKARQGEK